MFCMDNTAAALAALRGTTIQEKMVSIGVDKGRMIDIRHLDEISRDYGIRIYLFFEKDLATTRSLAEIQEEFRGVPEYERPYVRVDRFLAFTKENDPSFAQTIEEFPLMVEIVAVGEAVNPETGKSEPFATGLMPFLDEFDVDTDPVAANHGKPL
jgi:hypothetical protein